MQVDPGNVQLLDQHLTCAAVEAPLLPADEAYFGPGLRAATARLLKKSARTHTVPEQQRLPSACSEFMAAALAPVSVCLLQCRREGRVKRNISRGAIQLLHAR